MITQNSFPSIIQHLLYSLVDERRIGVLLNYEFLKTDIEALTDVFTYQEKIPANNIKLLYYL
jgi:hypothetical protein